MNKRNKFDFLRMKSARDPLAWITAYDYPTAYVAEKAGIDMILVGDSGGMVQLGYSSTNPVTMEEMLVLAKAARRGAPNTFLIGDMPQGTYEVSKTKAISNSIRFIKEAECDAVKVEGGKRIFDKVKAIVDAGLLVAGHLGLTPQSSSNFGGYRVQGKTLESFEPTVEDALALQDAGVFCLLLEAMPAEPAGQIAEQLDIPVYGIGAGNLVDGQLVILHDLIGFYPTFRPRFAKCYIPEIMKKFSEHVNSADREISKKQCQDGLLVIVEMALRQYIQEVKKRKFPEGNYIYKISPSDLDLLRASKYWIVQQVATTDEN